MYKRQHPSQEYIQVDTTNILFIVGGAFDGIKDIIKQRTNKKSIGFGSEDSENKEVSLADVTTEDLLKFGLIPEFIGRVPIVVSLEDLDVNSLVKILQEPKNSLLKQYQKLFELDGVKLTFEAVSYTHLIRTDKRRVKRNIKIKYMFMTSKK